MRVLVLAALPWLLPPALLARDIDVRLNGARVTIHARAASLTDVLDQVSRRTGMKVVYDGRPPRHVVNATIDDATQSDALFRLFEGLGINYALALDQGGQRVETLIITGVARPDLAKDEPTLAPNAPTAFRPTERPKPVFMRGAPPRPDQPKEAVDEDDDDEPEDPVAAAKGALVEEQPIEDDDEPEAAPAPVGPRFPVPSPSPSPAPR